MAIKSYLDISGLSYFHDKVVTNIIDATTKAKIDVAPSVNAITGYVDGKIKTSGTLDPTGTTQAPTEKLTADYVDDVIENKVGPAIDAKVSSVNYGDVTISGSAFYGIYTTNGTTKSVAAVDSTAGGTFESTSLITSGAVNEGLASINAAKENVSNKVTSLSSSSTDAQYPSAKCVYDALSTAGSVKDVKLNNTSVVVDGIASLTADTTAGGTFESTDLITSGAVNAGLAAIAEGVEGKVSDVKVNGTSVVTNKVANIDISGKEDSGNKVTSMSSASTDVQYPSAKSVYDVAAALDTRITNLQNIGRFLSIWNATTGLPTSEPTSTPYTYKTGDYYRVGVVGNLIPEGTSYTGAASTTTTTDTLAIGDVFYFDGSVWRRQESSGGGTVQDVQINGTTILSGGIANIIVDTTAGGTSGSSSLVTSGAVNEGLASVAVTKVDTTTTVNGHALSDNITVTASDVGLGNVGNFKAVSTVASQGLTDTEKSNARDNIGAGLTTIYRVTPSDVTVETDATKGVSPYSTSYGYTNITINTLNGGAVTALPTIAIGLTLQFECGGVLVVEAAYRNVRIRFTSSGSWIPLFANTGIAIGSSFFADGYTRLLTYRTDQYASGAFHAFTDSNTTYSHASLGQGYGTCATAAATAAKVVTFSGYSLTVGGIVAVKFTYAVPASATMNINSRGAKAIYYNGAAITANIINDGDLAYFIYNGSQYHYLGKDSAVSTSITSSSTDRQVPSAKAVYTAISSISSDTIKVAAQSSTMYLVGVPSASAGNQAAQVASSGTTHAYVTTDGYLYADRIYNAVWNDIADFVEVPEGFNVQYGKAYTRDKSGNIVLANNGKALGIASDTYGFGVGNKEGKHQMPIAIGGWVLAYTDEIYEPMTPLKAGKNGVLTKLLEEDRDYLCLGFFDRVEPNKEWNGLNVNGRHWIKVK